jgi:hypothetical protein
MEKFKKKQYTPGFNPVELFNDDFKTEEIVKSHKIYKADTKSRNILSETATAFIYNDELNVFTSTGECKDTKIPGGVGLTPFAALCHIRFHDDYRKAIKYIEFERLNQEIPYIRVGVNYFKRIKRTNRWGVECEEIKVWNKDTIKDDHGPQLLKRVHQFDDFTIEPCNNDYQPTVDGLWNLYEPFPHKAHPSPVSIDEIPNTANFMAHVFGHQIEIGYQYMKILYEMPKQILPVLVLVSKERNTGKSSFLNWIDIIFANNYTEIPPEDLNGSFNSHFAYRNIIGIDEAVIDKTSAIEKIKSIATAKTILVNTKNIAQYRIPFYGKIITTTNREADFMRVDSEEIRFWVRKLGPVPTDKVTNKFYDNLKAEVPKFLRYLADMPAVDVSKSRMVFTADQINNDELQKVKEESKSGLCKELEMLLEDMFANNPDLTEIRASPKDMKTRWFENNSSIGMNYIRKVLRDEFEMEPGDNQRYHPLDHYPHGDSRVGRPYLFTREKFADPSIVTSATEEKSPF